jgi:hypothetical protein
LPFPDFSFSFSFSFPLPPLGEILLPGVVDFAGAGEEAEEEPAGVEAGEAAAGRGILGMAADFSRVLDLGEAAAAAAEVDDEEEDGVLLEDDPEEDDDEDEDDDDDDDDDGDKENPAGGFKERPGELGEGMGSSMFIMPLKVTGSGSIPSNSHKDQTC